MHRKLASHLERSNFIFFVDFDGTLAQNDVGDAFFRTWGEWQSCHEAITRWERNEISSRALYEIAATHTRVTRAEFEAFCATQPLAAGVLEFVALCRNREWPVFVLSDGLDAYIHSILQRHHLNLPVYSNHLEFLPPDQVRVHFPYWAASCGRCANCKRQHVQRFTQPGQQSIYIGDGYSDRCGAFAAEVIFAKHNLAECCAQEHRTFVPFENFHDVVKHFAAR